MLDGHIVNCPLCKRLMVQVKRFVNGQPEVVNVCYFCKHEEPVKPQEKGGPLIIIGL